MVARHGAVEGDEGKDGNSMSYPLQFSCADERLKRFRQIFAVCTVFQKVIDLF